MRKQPEPGLSEAKTTRRRIRRGQAVPDFASAQSGLRSSTSNAISKPSGTTAQPSGIVAISEPDVAAAGPGNRAVIDLIVDAAVVSTNEMAVVIAAMVLMPARQQWHGGQTVGELLDGRRVLPLGTPVSCRTRRRHGGEQRRYPNPRLHSWHLHCRQRRYQIRWHRSRKISNYVPGADFHRFESHAPSPSLPRRGPC
jgi:hypothetical protein